MSLLTSTNDRKKDDSYFAPSSVINPQMIDIDLGGFLIPGGVLASKQSSSFIWNYDSTDFQASFSITSCLCTRAAGLNYEVLVITAALPRGLTLIPSTYDHTVTWSTSNAINSSAMYSPDAIAIPKGTPCVIQFSIQTDAGADVTISAGTAVLSLTPSKQFP